MIRWYSLSTSLQPIAAQDWICLDYPNTSFDRSWDSSHTRGVFETAPTSSRATSCARPLRLSRGSVLSLRSGNLLRLCELLHSILLRSGIRSGKSRYDQSTSLLSTIHS